MTRTILGTVALLMLSSAIAAQAADYPDLRPAYQEGWEQPDDDVRFEFGTAYWYSWGGQDSGYTASSGGTTLGNIGVSSRDVTHLIDLHTKVEDLSTQTYVNVRGALGLNTTGTYNISNAGSGAIGRGSRIGYAGADFGWLPWGTMTNGMAFGGLVGYQYWKEAPEIGTGQYATGFTGGLPSSFSAARNDLDIHAIRLGLRGTADFDAFDFQAEVAAVPYAQVSGTIGGSSPNGFTLGGTTYYERAPTTLTGRGYGVMAEAMAGFRPTENLSLRLGGRAWYLEGPLEATLTTNAGGTNRAPISAQTNYASFFRYGIMAELTGRF